MEGKVTAVEEGLINQFAGRPATEFPSHTFPSAFADGVSGYARGEGVIKIFFYRTDPNMFGRGGFAYNPFAQVIMPNEGFVRSVILLQRALNSMIESGHVTKEQVDDVSKKLDTLNNPIPHA